MVYKYTNEELQVTISAGDAICAFVPPFLRFLREGVTKVDLSPARFQTLQALSGGTVLSMVELADRLSVTKRNVTSLVDALENDGLAARRPHPTDRRSKLVQLTQAGETVFAQAASVQREHLEKLVSCLEPKEREALSKGLTRLTDALTQAREQP